MLALGIPSMRELMAHSVNLWESDPSGLHYHPVGYMQISCEAMRDDVSQIYEQQQAIGYESVFIEGASASDAYMKDMFNDFEFRDGVNLAGVNSINWARVLAQVVYYFSSAVKLGAPNKKISFSVPTGNFGDIFAGFIAKKMGLSIDRLVVATNQNDILHRCLTSGVYKTDKVLPSISPSMDIQVSSNFERALFYAADCDSKKVSALMDELKNTGQFKVSESILEKLQECFVSGRVSEEETLSEIAYSYQKYSEILCPHSAVGVFVGRKQSDADVPMVTLATAHPAKFPKAVEKATSIYPKLPSRMADLFDLKERITIVENNLQSIESVVRERIQT